MSSARNHAKRSHRSHYNTRIYTGHSARRAVIREHTKPRRQSSFFARLLSKLTRKGREESKA